MLNSQLWGELPPVVLRKGLQPVTLSLCSFSTRLLFPIIAFCIDDALVYSMTDFELNVQSFEVAPLNFFLYMLGRPSTSMVWHNRFKVNV